jgi:hypothetical protein
MHADCCRRARPRRTRRWIVLTSEDRGRAAAAGSCRVPPGMLEARTRQRLRHLRTGWSRPRGRGSRSCALLAWLLVADQHCENAPRKLTFAGRGGRPILGATPKQPNGADVALGEALCARRRCRAAAADPETRGGLAQGSPSCARRPAHRTFGLLSGSDSRSTIVVWRLPASLPGWPV